MTIKDTRKTELMNSAQKSPPGEIPTHWRKSRPIAWRLRSLINQRKRARG